MLWITRIPTHQNDASPMPADLLERVLDMVRDRFGGYSLDGPGSGVWKDDEDRVYD